MYFTVFKDESHLIPKNTSVIVARVPIDKRRGMQQGGGGGAFTHRNRHLQQQQQQMTPPNLPASAVVAKANTHLNPFLLFLNYFKPKNLINFTELNSNISNSCIL